MMKTLKSLIKSFLKLFVRVEGRSLDRKAKGYYIVKYYLLFLPLFTKYYRTIDCVEYRLFDVIPIMKKHKDINKLINQVQNNYPLILSRIRTRVAGGGGGYPRWISCSFR